MELTDDQRGDLAAMREAAVAAAPHAYARDARPAGGKEAFQVWGRKLDALGAAWSELDHDTKMHLVVALVARWAGDEGQAVPDLSDIARGLREELTLPPHPVEAHPGLAEATKYLWRIWAGSRPGCVPIDRTATGSIAAEVAALFGLAVADAERRVENILRAWDKGRGALRETDMPGRGAARFSRDGLRLS